MADELTQRGYPLPSPDNIAREDATRIRNAITLISDDLTMLEGRDVQASEAVCGGVRLATAGEATAGTATNAVPVVKRVKDMITAVTNALHTTIVSEYGAAIATAINNLKGGVDPAYDTLVEIAAKLTDMTQINAILDSLAKRLRVDTASQGLDATSQSNGRVNLGLGSASTKNISASANIRANSGTDVITTDQAWASAAFVDLGTVAGAVNVDCGAGIRFRAILSGNITINFLNAKDGQGIDVVLVQDGTGGRTVSWNSNVRFPGGLAPTVATAANGWALVFTGVYCSNFAQWLACGWKNS
ncbi:hypothetical protein [Bradyrhizobium sp. HKCCYLS20291]|uniref:hypothetical protein n=1 Tax=Bradyrhizobium sp. HKCCYLS20291 TaxID=3420766 RepID=UPI003EB9DE1F